MDKVWSAISKKNGFLFIQRNTEAEVKEFVDYLIKGGVPFTEMDIIITDEEERQEKYFEPPYV